MPDRRSPEITESIAEALRAGLALIAVVLLARANVGALTRTPSIWVALPVGLLAWGAAAWAARWTASRSGSRLVVWRDCLAPALLTLMLAGRGGSGTLAWAIGLIGVGSVAVGWAAGCCRVDVRPPERVVPEREPIGDESITPHRVVDEPEASVPPASAATASPLSVSVTPGPGGPGYGEAELAEIVESAVDESIPPESWIRTEADGEVSIEAVVLARFAEGAKLAVVHLPFVPPLPSVPQIECEPLESGCDVTIKTEAAYRHGARLSVTRPTAGPEESVPIGVVVYTSAEEPVEL